MWNLFLDDERFPALDDRDWTIARTKAEAVELIQQRGLPDMMSLDHDLGQAQPTGMDFAKWLVEWCMDGNWPLVRFTVHSMNPVGAKNIQCLLDQYNRVRPK